MWGDCLLAGHKFGDVIQNLHNDNLCWISPEILLLSFFSFFFSFFFKLSYRSFVLCVLIIHIDLHALNCVSFIDLESFWRSHESVMINEILSFCFWILACWYVTCPHQRHKHTCYLYFLLVPDWTVELWRGCRRGWRKISTRPRMI